MKIYIIIFIFLLSLKVISSEITIKQIKSRLKSDSLATFGDIKKSGSNFLVNLSFDKSITKSLKAFSKNKKDINQVALYIYPCGRDGLSNKKIGIASKDFYESIVSKLFKIKFKLKGLYLDNLNFSEKYYVKGHKQFRKVRIKKELYKCDGQGSVGYRLDLFLK